MAPDRIAVVSDVHGNVTAYEAVLADITDRGIDVVVNLGDVAGKGPRGSHAVALTRQRCAATVRGNWEGYLTADDPPRNPALHWWRSELTVADKEWLRALPAVIDLELSGRGVRLLHASAVDEFTRVRHDHSDEEFAGMFASTPFTRDREVLGSGPGDVGGFSPTVVVYGDIHDAYLEVRSGRTLVNTGSVGNSLDGDTAASYVILEGRLDAADASFGIQFVRVPYDIEAEIAVARELDMPDWEPYAIELRTGVYRGLHAQLGLTVE